MSSGSSPRVRGTERTMKEDGAVLRFIPARAGNRICSGPKVATATVHPRACGEQTIEELGQRINDGSSPRVRGTASRYLR